MVGNLKTLQFRLVQNKGIQISNAHNYDPKLNYNNLFYKKYLAHYYISKIYQVYFANLKKYLADRSHFQIF